MKNTSMHCLLVRTDDDTADELAFELSDLGAVAVEQRDSSTMTSVEPGEALLIAGFENEQARDHAEVNLASKESLGPKPEIKAALIDDDGWSTAWQKFFQPVVFNRLQIVMPWMTPPRSDLESIKIEPAQAFGTGGHATTRLVVKMLEKRADDGLIPDDVLDVGCGSGVLAIAAAKLGAKRVLGVDIEEESTAATLENAKVNGVGAQIEASCGTVDKADGTWPLVLANIELLIFKTEAAKIATRVVKGGEALLSGLLVDQQSECLKLWPGFELTERMEEDGWISLALKKK